MVRRLLVLNGLAAVLAVLHHSVIWALTAMCWWTDRYRATSVPNFDQIGGPAFHAIRFVDQFAQAAVPAFLFSSGFFVAIVAADSKRHGWWTFVRSRLGRLLPPYLIWSAVMLGLSASKGQPASPSSLATALLVGGAAPPYYYVPLLVQLTLLAPLLTAATSRYWMPVMAAAWLLQALVALARSGALVSGLPVDMPVLRTLVNSNLAGFSFWFLLGVFGSLHLPVFRRVILGIRPALPAVVAVTLVASFAEWELTRRGAGRWWISGGVVLSDNLLALTLLAAFLAFDGITTPVDRLLGSIGSMAYGVYLTHVLVLEVGARTAYHLTPGLLAHQVVLLFVLTATGVVVPLLAMRAVAASPLRRWYVWIFG